MRPLRGLQEIRVATQGESGVLGFPSRRALIPRGSLECNPEIPAFPGTCPFNNPGGACVHSQGPRVGTQSGAAACPPLRVLQREAEDNGVLAQV